MAVQGVVALANLIPEIWSQQMYDELRNNVMFLNFFETKYVQDLQFGDIVRVNQIAAPAAESLTDDTAAFNTQSLVVNQKSVTVDRRISAAFDISDLAQLQALSFQQEAISALSYAIRKKLEEQIIAALIPSAAAPDHDIAPATPGTLAGVDVATMRGLLSTALVPVSGRALMLAPSYYTDLLNETKIMSRDFTSGNSAEAGVADAFLGFQIMEHNLLANDVGYAAHPSAMSIVIQQQPRVQISNLHPTGYYGYRVSADLVVGFSLWDNKRIVKISG